MAGVSSARKQASLFDLNVEKILDHWGVAEAIREVIANALDEQALSGTAEPRIVKRRDGWHVTDFGRGLHYQHLTQNENPEKRRKSALVVGKFGVGLKDALATFYRRGIEVKVRTARADITLQRAAKSNFADVKTLHAAISPPSEPNRRGTDFILSGLPDADMAAARDYFLRFAGDEELERTDFGTILQRRPNEPARIYVKGVRVAVEEQFLFSYNITSTTAQLQRALNRERANVGRSAYQDRVKAILLKATSDVIAEQLAQDLTRIPAGTNHDEILARCAGASRPDPGDQGQNCLRHLAADVHHGGDHHRSKGRRLQGDHDSRPLAGASREPARPQRRPHPRHQRFHPGMERVVHVRLHRCLQAQEGGAGDLADPARAAAPGRRPREAREGDPDLEHDAAR